MFKCYVIQVLKSKSSLLLFSVEIPTSCILHMAQQDQVAGHVTMA